MKTPIQIKYDAYRSSARVRNRDFELSYQDFVDLSKLPCAYCGDTFFGIDRIDSSKGYLKNNCVPCCKICNRMKLDLSVETFVEQCDKIHNYLQGV